MVSYDNYCVYFVKCYLFVGKITIHAKKTWFEKVTTRKASGRIWSSYQHSQKKHYNKKQKNVDYDVFNVWIFVYESVEIALSTVLEC